MMRTILLLIVSFVCAVLIPAGPSSAETYQYVDENGTMSFTDNPVSIPKSARKSKSMGDIENADDSVTTFRLINNHVIVAVSVIFKGREVKGQFVFDTGANSSVISPDLARRLNISDRDTSVAMMQGVGSSGAVSTVVLDAIKLDGKAAGNLEVSVVGFANYDGLLGMDFLAGKKFQIDYHGRKIRWM
ncbi:MAG: retroviral-like aspartic protease family protein [Geobacteraceae bacterium]|nr:retroviral-like aspartic protease family protein [Geobacteraceae bacterium]